MTFTTASGHQVTLTISTGGSVYVALRAGKIDINHSGQRINDATHGPAILVKHGYSTSMIRVPAAALAEVDAIFAEAAARVAKAAARAAIIDAEEAEYDASYARTMRALNTGRA